MKKPQMIGVQKEAREIDEARELAGLECLKDIAVEDESLEPGTRLEHTSGELTQTIVSELELAKTSQSAKRCGTYLRKVGFWRRGIT